MTHVPPITTKVRNSHLISRWRFSISYCSNTISGCTQAVFKIIDKVNNHNHLSIVQTGVKHILQRKQKKSENVTEENKNCIEIAPTAWHWSNLSETTYNCTHVNSRSKMSTHLSIRDFCPLFRSPRFASELKRLVSWSLSAAKQLIFFQLLLQVITSSLLEKSWKQLQGNAWNLPQT